MTPLESARPPAGGQQGGHTINHRQLSPTAGPVQGKNGQHGGRNGAAQTETLPPQDPEAEQTVLGILLVHCDKADVTNKIFAVSPDCFFDLRNQEIFLVARDLHQQGITPDIEVLTEALSKANKSHLVQYAGYLSDKGWSDVNLDYYLGRLREAYLKRQLLKCSSEVIQGLSQPGANSKELIALTKDKLGRLEMTLAETGDLLSPETIISTLPDPQVCLLGDFLLTRGGQMVIAGPAGVGKSRLALQLAVCLATGRPFLNIQTHNGPLRILVVQAENGHHRLHRDLTALRRWVEPEDWQKVDANVRFLPQQIVQDMQPGKTESLVSLARYCDRALADLVIIDPLNYFILGDPNSDQDMFNTLQWLRSTIRSGNPARAIVLIHHSLTGRAAAIKATGYERGSFARNSKVLLGWTRGQINIVAYEENTNDAVVVSCGKCSDGREFPTFVARLDPETMIYTVDPNADLGGWRERITKPVKYQQGFSVEVVRQLCEPSMPKAALVRKLMTEKGIGKSKAYDLINKATGTTIAHDTRTNTFSPIV
ncbi:MAG: AAA family ATPase [Verrucomicrobiae bacterium]|nr:AAA family ATPase [Verrucomicrobiae bacterium]